MPFANRPVIGVTASLLDGRLTIPAAYLTAVERAGGLPVVLWHGRDAEGALGLLSGVVFSGGEDVDPARYGQPRHEKTVVVAPERDAFELALARLADGRVPVLGICRGSQVVNVALGGTLHQHVPDTYGGSVRHADPETRHPADIVPGSFLASALGERAEVNSTHHQSADRLAPGFALTAKAPDGVTEGFEKGRTVCVQWHPERLPETMSALFERFIALCGDGLGRLA